jgi:hypothetical protein
MSIDRYTYSQLRKLKIENGIGIDTTGTGSAYIYETKLRRLITAEYRNNPDYALLFCSLRKTKNGAARTGLPYTICINRLEKCEGWQLELLLETAQEESVGSAIIQMFSIKKSDKFKILKARMKADKEPDMDSLLDKHLKNLD